MEMQIVDLKDGFGKGMPVDFLSLVSPIGNRITDGGIERWLIRSEKALDSAKNHINNINKLVRKIG